MFWKKKTRPEIIAKKVEDILHDLKVCGFPNKEIAVIICSLSHEAKAMLEARRVTEEKQLKETVNAINLMP